MMRANSVRLPTAALALLLVSCFSVSCAKTEDPVAPKVPAVYATMETDKGTIEIELLPTEAPKTVENFRLLSERGYYNGVLVFRVVKGFMMQTGDPLNNGKGGQSAWGAPFADEIDRSSPRYRGGYKRGTVAMANSGPNTNTSQFFVVQKDFPLHPGFTIFGHVVSGMEVVDAIADLPMERGIDGGMSKPLTMPVIKRISIHGGTVPLAAPAK